MKPKNVTKYFVHQYAPNGKLRPWKEFGSAKELSEFLENIIISGSDCRITKSVLRITDVTDQYLK